LRSQGGLQLELTGVDRLLSYARDLGVQKARPVGAGESAVDSANTPTRADRNREIEANDGVRVSLSSAASQVPSVDAAGQAAEASAASLEGALPKPEGSARGNAPDGYIQRDPAMRGTRIAIRA